MKREPLRLILGRMDSPIGQVLTATDADGVLRALDFHDYEDRLRRLLIRHYGAVALVEGEAPEPVRASLQAWFAGDLRAFDGLSITTGGTEFQRRVWAALRDIPAGETRSYGQLAAAIGQPTAVRAVGLANGANPVGIVTPCHRVIGAGGALTGYAGGVERKRWLLEHERAAVARP